MIRIKSLFFLVLLFTTNVFGMDLGDPPIQMQPLIAGTMFHMIEDPSFYPELHSLINSGAPVNIQNECGETLVHRAVMKENDNLLELLLRNGAGSDVPDDNGRRPLLLAASAGNINIVKLLLDFRASVNSGDDSGCCPLHAAVENPAVVQMLLEGGARSGEAAGDEGIFPLHLAVDRGVIESAKLLINHGCLVNRRDVLKGQTAFNLAVEKGKLDIAELLARNYADINSADNGGITPLHRAVDMGHENIVKFLIKDPFNKFHIDINIQSRDGETPLHWAVKRDSLSCVQMLVENGANVNLRDSKGYTPLLSCFLDYFNQRRPIQQRKEVAELLLSHGADIDEKGDDEKTLLQLAVEQGNKDLFNFLLGNFNPTVNIKDRSGNTPLHCAINHCISKYRDESPFKYMIEQLISCNADVNIKNKAGISPLLLICLLSDNGYHSVISDYSSVVLSLFNLLLEHGADINITDEFGNSPLHIAANRGFLGLVECLLRKGADIETKNAGGKKPFDMVLSCGYSILNDVEKLREAVKECDIERLNIIRSYHLKNDSIYFAKNSMGDSFLHSAILNRDKEIVKALMGIPGLIEVENKQGMNAIQLAVRYPEMLKVLMTGGYEKEKRVYNKVERITARHGEYDITDYLLKKGMSDKGFFARWYHKLFRRSCSTLKKRVMSVFANLRSHFSNRTSFNSTSMMNRIMYRLWQDISRTFEEDLCAEPSPITFAFACA